VLAPEQRPHCTQYERAKWGSVPGVPEGLNENQSLANWPCGQGDQGSLIWVGERLGSPPIGPCWAAAPAEDLVTGSAHDTGALHAYSSDGPHPGWSLTKNATRVRQGSGIRRTTIDRTRSPKPDVSSWENSCFIICDKCCCASTREMHGRGRSIGTASDPPQGLSWLPRSQLLPAQVWTME